MALPVLTAGRAWGRARAQQSGHQGLGGHIRDSVPVVVFLAQGIFGEFEGEAESGGASVLMPHVAFWLVVSAVVASLGRPLDREPRFAWSSPSTTVSVTPRMWS